MATNYIVSAEIDEVDRLERKEQFSSFHRYIKRASYGFGSVMKILNEVPDNNKLPSRTSKAQAEIKISEACGGDPDLIKIYKAEQIREKFKEDKRLEEDKQKFSIFLDSKIGKEIRRLLRDTTYQESMLVGDVMEMLNLIRRICYEEGSLISHKDQVQNNFENHAQGKMNLEDYIATFDRLHEDCNRMGAKYTEEDLKRIFLRGLNTRIYGQLL